MKLTFKVVPLAKKAGKVADGEFLPLLHEVGDIAIVCVKAREAFADDEAYQVAVTEARKRLYGGSLGIPTRCMVPDESGNIVQKAGSAKKAGESRFKGRALDSLITVPVAAEAAKQIPDAVRKAGGWDEAVASDGSIRFHAVQRYA